jgi:hypothetical protein
LPIVQQMTTQIRMRRYDDKSIYDANPQRSEGLDELCGYPTASMTLEANEVVPSALYDNPRVAAESSCRRRSASTSFPAVISKDVDGGPPPAMTMTTNRRVNDFGAWTSAASAVLA